MQVIRRKLTAISYGAKGQDPGRLFKAYDRDGSGQLDWEGFHSNWREKFHLKGSDSQLYALFNMLDVDGHQKGINQFDVRSVLVKT